MSPADARVCLCESSCPLLALDHPCGKGLFGNSGGGFQLRPSAETVPAAQKSLKAAQEPFLDAPFPVPGRASWNRTGAASLHRLLGSTIR